MPPDLRKTGPALCFALCLLVLCVISGADVCADGPEENTLQPIHNPEILEILGKAEKATAKGKILKNLKDYTKKQRLETLAYALNEDKHTATALQAIIDDVEMRDLGLAPFVAKVMRTAKDRELLLAARVAKHLPDQVLLSPLIEHALDSEYFEVTTAIVKPHYERYYDSVFREAAEALYRISNGRIGSEKVRRDKLPSEEERKALIGEWKETWRRMQTEKGQGG